MDKRLAVAGVLVLILALFLVASAVAQVQVPPAGKSVEYYLQWMDKSLIGGGATPAGGPSGGPSGPGAGVQPNGNLPVDYSKLSFNGTQIKIGNYNNSTLLCFYRVSSDVVSKYVRANSNIISGYEANLKGVTLSAYKLNDAGYFAVPLGYYQNYPSSCFSLSGFDTNVSPIESFGAIATSRSDLWDNGAWLSFNFNGLVLQKYTSNGTRLAKDDSASEVITLDAQKEIILKNAAGANVLKVNVIAAAPTFGYNNLILVSLGPAN